jgi:hypothetical protein
LEYNVNSISFVLLLQKYLLLLLFIDRFICWESGLNVCFKTIFDVICLLLLNKEL